MLLYLGRLTNHNNKTPFIQNSKLNHDLPKKRIALSKTQQIFKLDSEASWKQNKK
jgi:hypothetical protein